MSKYASRIIAFLKFAVEQGLLFNLPPVGSKHPDTGEFARRIYEQPDKDGYYTCKVCQDKITEDGPWSISAWVESDGEEEKTFYDPKIDPTYSSKVLGALYEAKELTDTFIEEYEKLPPLPQYDFNIPGSWEEYSKIKSRYDLLIQDFNHTLQAIPESYFPGEEVYNPIKWIYNRSLSTYFPQYHGGAGRTLEDAHSIINELDRQTQQVKQEGVEPVKYKSVIMKPICPSCYDDQVVKCEWCGEQGLLQGEDDAATYKKINHNDYLCKKCYENASFCENCQETIHSDESYYDERNERTLCQSCYERLPRSSYDTDPVKNIVRKIEKIETFFPVDVKQIDKTILPKVLLPLRGKPFSLDAVKRQADKANLAPELKTFLFQTIQSENPTTLEDLLGKLSRQIESDKQQKEKYPQLKRFNKIPLDVKVEEESDRDMPSFTITIRPTQSFINYAESMFPGQGKAAYARLSRGGHHDGAMAYARIGYDEDENAFVINNLQTDADLQKLVDSSSGELPESLKAMEPAMRWWLKQFENWPAQLLDIIHQFGKQMDTAVYLTTFDMQKKKWGRIPDRNKDVYDKVPAQMGFQQEDVSMNVETLDKDDYTMYRIARLIRARKLRKCLKH